MTKPGRYLCPVAGCGDVTWSERWAARHAAQRHEQCSCGWVGVHFNGHLAALRRHDHETVGHALCASWVPA